MLRPISVQTLIEMTEDAAADQGIRCRNLIAPAGSYRRRAPRYVGEEHITQLELVREQSAALVQLHPPVYRIAMEATVAGQGAVTTQGGRLVAESAAEFLNHHRAPDGLLQAADGAFMLSAPVARHVSIPSLLVKRPWWRNYGHWLIDGAALLAMIPWGKMPREWQIVVGPPESGAMRQVIRDTLDVLAPNVPVVEQPDHEPWSFSDLHYITPVHIPPLFKLPAARHVLRMAFLRDLPSPEKPTRFYVQREPINGRGVENEAALIDVCTERGLRVVRPERLTLREQAFLFATCDLVVGVKGAALSNAIFSTSPMGVVVLSPGTWTEPFYWDLVGQADIDYTEIVGPVVNDALGCSNNNFRINPVLLAAVLDEQIARLDSSALRVAPAPFGAPIAI